MADSRAVQKVLGYRLTTSLSYLLRAIDWVEVEQALRRHYPQEVRHLASFRRVFDELTRMPPEPTTCWLVIQPFEPWLDPVCDPPHGEAPAGVCCTDGSFCELRRGEILYGIDFRSWAECLGMEVQDVTRERYSDPEIVAHCLWEMTWHGFDEVAGQDFFAELQERSRGAKTDFITLDELKLRVDAAYEGDDAEKSVDANDGCEKDGARNKP